MNTITKSQSKWVKTFILPGLFLIGILLLSACGTITTQGTGNLETETINVNNFDRISFRGIGDLLITQSGEESLTIETDKNIMRYISVEVRNGTLYIDNRDMVLISPTRLTYNLNVDQLTVLFIGGSGDIIIDDIDTNHLEIELGGSGDIEIDDIEADRLEVENHGSGDIQIDSISVDITDIRKNGSGSIEIESLTSEALDIQLSGSGYLEIDSLFSDELELSSSGSGDVRLAGEAPYQDISLSGSGKYQAGNLKSETTNLTIGGSGSAEVWVTEILEVRIGGSGDVNYYGTPRMDFSGTGSGDLNSLGDK